MECNRVRWPLPPDDRTVCNCLCPAPAVDVQLSSPRVVRAPVLDVHALVQQQQRTSVESDCVTRLVYHPSPWEAWWADRVALLMESRRGWTCGCHALRSPQHLRLVSEWRLWSHQNDKEAQLRSPNKAGCVASGLGGGWPSAVFSYHSVVQTCNSSSFAATTSLELAKFPIEPLIGFLRPPHFMGIFCQSDLNTFTSIANPNGYLLPLSRCHGDLSDIALRPWFGLGSARSRNLLFDLGASRWAVGPGGGSLRWMVQTYRRRGILFDRILAWEAANSTGRQIFEYMPHQALDAISYYNVPVDSAPNAWNNPLRTLRAIAQPLDFVVLKLDIDPCQSLEESLINQILADEHLASLVDELYYEHHVHLTPMVDKGWGEGLRHDCAGRATEQTMRTSYDIFQRLRRQGIRAHSWI